MKKPMRDEMLIAWLCVVAFNLERDEKVCLWLPTRIKDELVARGWVQADEAPDWEGSTGTAVTAAGQIIVDLHGAEWGLDTIPAAD